MTTYYNTFEVPSHPFGPRPRGLLLDVALPLDLSHPLGDEGERGFDPDEKVIGGVNFCGSNACFDVLGQPNLWCEDPDDETPLPWAGEDYEFPDSTPAEFGSFSVVTAEQAPADFRYEWLRRRASERMRAQWSAAVARELMTGELSGNPSLQNSVDQQVVAATALANVPFVMEDVIATFGNIELAIHMDPGTFTYLAGSWEIEQDDAESAEDPNNRPFRTPTGHVVIADAGYKPHAGDDFAPEGQTTSASSRWIYASPLPRVWLGPERYIGDETANFDRETNKTHVILERSALVAFDLCPVVAVQVDVPDYTVADVGSGS